MWATLASQTWKQSWGLSKTILANYISACRAVVLMRARRGASIWNSAGAAVRGPLLLIQVPTLLIIPGFILPTVLDLVLLSRGLACTCELNRPRVANTNRGTVLSRDTSIGTSTRSPKHSIRARQLPHDPEQPKPPRRLSAIHAGASGTWSDGTPV